MTMDELKIYLSKRIKEIEENPMYPAYCMEAQVNTFQEILDAVSN